MRNPNFPQNLIENITGGKIDFEIPSDFVGTLYYVLYSTMEKRESDILLAYFTTEATYASIGKEYGIGNERVRQIICRAIYKLRMPSRRTLLFTGVKEEKKNAYETGFKDGESITKQEIIRMLTPNFLSCDTSVINIPEANVIRVEDMELSERTLNCLKRGGMNTLADVLRAKKDGLKKIRCLGTKCYNEIVDRLVKKYGQDYSAWSLE